MEQRPDGDSPQRHRALLLALDHPRGRRREIEQRPQRAAGALAGAEFQHLPEQHEHGDDGGRLEVDGGVGGVACGRWERLREQQGGGLGVRLGMLGGGVLERDGALVLLADAGGDVAKLNCATCHPGAFKPLYGVSMLKDHPELAGGAARAQPVSMEAAPATPSSMVVLFFAVNSPTLPEDAIARLTNVVAALKANPQFKAAISGYHSAAGSLPQNQELAKNRAMAVRDALTAAGIETGRLELDKPMSAEANLSGEDPQARRVEVTMK